MSSKDTSSTSSNEETPSNFPCEELSIITKEKYFFDTNSSTTCVSDDSVTFGIDAIFFLCCFEFKLI